MGSVGDAYDNAMCESFFATLECELLNRKTFQTKANLRLHRRLVQPESTPFRNRIRITHPVRKKRSDPKPNLKSLSVYETGGTPMRDGKAAAP